MRMRVGANYQPTFPIAIYDSQEDGVAYFMVGKEVVTAGGIIYYESIPWGPCNVQASGPQNTFAIGANNPVQTTTPLINVDFTRCIIQFGSNGGYLPRAVLQCIYTFV